jgi:orotate phosphoribosyltransferase
LDARLSNKVASQNNRVLSETYLRVRHAKQIFAGKQFTFVTVNKMVKWTTEWIKLFPTNYDIIVGIPRSGLLVATVVALKLGKPVTTPELFAQNQYWKSKLIDKIEQYTTVLLIDDSATSGKAMVESYQLLKSYNKNLMITKAALIVTEESKEFVDLYYKIVPHPRIFEWNLMHAKKGKVASDLDGVICENCPEGVDSDEHLYVEWLKKARPYLIPSFEIDVIISSRLEKYRSETETWLSKHGVRYKKLILWNIKSKQERNGRHAEHKIGVLLKIKPEFFWESSFWEAKQIWENTRIPTLCIDEMILFG